MRGGAVTVVREGVYVRDGAGVTVRGAVLTRDRDGAVGAWVRAGGAVTTVGVLSGVRLGMPVMPWEGAVCVRLGMPVMPCVAREGAWLRSGVTAVEGVRPVEREPVHAPERGTVRCGAETSGVVREGVALSVRVPLVTPRLREATEPSLWPGRTAAGALGPRSGVDGVVTERERVVRELVVSSVRPMLPRLGIALSVCVARPCVERVAIPSVPRFAREVSQLGVAFTDTERMRAEGLLLAMDVRVLLLPVRAMVAKAVRPRVDSRD